MAGPGNKYSLLQKASLAVVLITNFVNAYSATALNIAVPSIGIEFHIPAAVLSWVVLVFILTTTLCSIPFGRIADIYGRRIILKAGIMIFGAASLLSVFSTGLVMFFICRVAQGIGSAMIFATNVPILVGAFPAEKRGSVIGLSTAAMFAGAASGPVIGGLLTHAFGWRSIFIAISAFAFTVLIVAMLSLPKEEKVNPVIKLNSMSMFLYMISFGVFMVGFAIFAQNIWSYFIFAAGLILMFIFIKHEAQTEVPILELRLFKGNRIFVLSNIASFFQFMAIFSVSYLMSIYLQLVRGFGADISGIIMICQAVVQIALAPVTGRMSDKKSPAVISSMGIICCGSALVMFAFLNQQTTILFIVGGLLLTGLGGSLFAPPNSNIIYSSVSNKDYSIASSILSTMHSFGQVTSMAVLTIIANGIIGVIPISEVAPEYLVRMINVSYAIFAAIGFTGAIVSLQRCKKL